MKKIRKIWWHSVPIDTLKTEINNLCWILVFTGSQWSVLSSDVGLHARVYRGQVGLHGVCLSSRELTVCCFCCWFVVDVMIAIW